MRRKPPATATLATYSHRARPRLYLILGSTHLGVVAHVFGHTGCAVWDILFGIIYSLDGNFQIS
jgi:hypothetical protein